MTRISECNAAEIEMHRAQLIDLLADVVNDGASIGFMPPLDPLAATAYWQSRQKAVEAGECLLVAAWLDDHIVGSAQLGLELRANGSHRAEVQKLMVHTAYRRRGIGRDLMQHLHEWAAAHGRTTLVLDTRQGDPSEIVNQGLGYTLAGNIPNYARSANGDLHATAFYYKLLD
jgi:ribosomal protein S18 acetylase RimI-like enzyme